MPFGRDAKARANMRADEIQATATARAGEDVESGFKPIVEAVRDLDRLVPGVIRGQRAVVSLLRPLHGEVIVQLDHGDAARDGFRAVDLELVVILTTSVANKQIDAKARAAPNVIRVFSVVVSPNGFETARAFYNIIARIERG